jgi:hypothetical protein
MITVKVDIKNIDKLRSNFSRAPTTALRYLSKATQASIFEVEKQAVDRNFQFKTPRAQRTGQLALSFAYGRHIAPGGLSASIGPTATHKGFYYPGAVYSGTSRGIKPNPYMDRIAEAATPAINAHFERAIDLFVSDLAKI